MTGRGSIEFGNNSLNFHNGKYVRFQFDIEHVKDKENVIADTLGRLTVNQGEDENDSISNEDVEINSNELFKQDNIETVHSEANNFTYKNNSKTVKSF